MMSLLKLMVVKDILVAQVDEVFLQPTPVNDPTKEHKSCLVS